MSAATDFSSVDIVAREHLRALLERWLPGGEHTGDTYTYTEPLGRFVVDLKTGAWRHNRGSGVRDGVTWRPTGGKLSGVGAVALRQRIRWCRTGDDDKANAAEDVASQIDQIVNPAPPAAKVRRKKPIKQDPTKGPLKGFTAGANATLKAALTLARERGWAVFPLHANGVPGQGSHGYQDASTGPDAIVKLWERWPLPLIGIATGAVSMVDVLDVDFKYPGAHVWWHAHCDRLPRTLTFRSKSDGLHLYLIHAEGIRCSQGRVGPNIDVKGDGGQITYRPDGECLDTSVPAAWPGWLLEQAQAPPTPEPEPVEPREPTDFDRARIAGILTKVANAMEGERNALLFWGACKLRGLVAEGVIELDEACDELLLAATEAGLTDKDAIPTIASGMRGR